MSVDPWQLAQNTALRRAFETRRRLAVARDAPVNVFDSCSQLGLHVRFLDCKSLEGMYCREPRAAIYLPSSRHRPFGRIAFTCAHELGHHELGHGTRVDELQDAATKGRRKPEEYGADVFAGHFLMPRLAVLRLARTRQWQLETMSPLQILTLAGVCGVGYTTLLTHLSQGLALLSPEQTLALKKTSPKEIRASVWPDSATGRLIVVDDLWPSIPIDLEAGDFLALSRETTSMPPQLAPVGATEAFQVVRAAVPGTGGLVVKERRIVVRVARAGYVGTWRHRFEPEDE